MLTTKYQIKVRAPPEVVELIRMANAILGIVSSDGLWVTMSALCSIFTRCSNLF